MRVVYKDLKQGEIKLVTENLDDIWHIYNLIEPGDLVRAITYRTDEQKNDLIRSKKVQKKRMKLGIRVEKISFHEFSDRLRVHGTIEEGPQEHGSYHTLNIDAEKMEPFSIVKNVWKLYELDRINEAVKQRFQQLLIFVALDEDSATIALLRQSGVQLIATIESHRSGKMYNSNTTEEDYFQEIMMILKNLNQYQSPLIIIGPGFTREHLMTYIRIHYPESFTQIHTHSTGNAGMNGIQETLKTNIIHKIIKENRVVKETQYIEKIFEKIQKNGLVTYGYKKVKETLEKGAVSHLFIIDTYVRSVNGEELLRLARDTKSEFTIINSLHEAGKKFEGLGGVAALLRFKLD